MNKPKTLKPKKTKASAPIEKNDAWPGLKAFELFGGLFEDAVGLAFRKALKGAAEWESRGNRFYRKLWNAVAEKQEMSRHPLTGDGLQDYWQEKFLDHPNVLHRKAELAPYDQIGAPLKKAYIEELGHFLKIVRTDWEKNFRDQKGKASGGALPSFSGFRPLESAKTLSASVKARQDLKEKLLNPSALASQLLPEIAAYFHEQGFGLFGRFRAFRWNSRKQSLDGVEALDPIRLENLVGYDEQRKPLLENIQAFLKGKPANNALLYGERGTGKSSTVKALLNAYHAQGLRLIEVLSAHLMDFPVILSHLRGRPEKFILFVDDLSFEENETSYKGLKAVLEGTLEASPQNVILIATSNRRHLIREFFGDRAGGVVEDGEIHGADTVEEKLSLADRFGLVISFYAPDQDTFLKMVDEWAKFEGIKMAEGELHLKAVQWTRFNNGRSGRAARQFVNDLKGKTS